MTGVARRKRSLASPLACITICGLLSATRASAQDITHRFRAGGELGYAFPTGMLERGSRVSDLTAGTPQLDLAALYAVSRRWALGFAIRAGVNIPTICAQASDCFASLGPRWQLALRGEFRLDLKPQPVLDLEIGFDTLTLRTADSGVVSTRTYQGAYCALGSALMFLVSGTFSIGPSLALSVGEFQRVTLRAPGVRSAHATEAPSLRVVPSIGARTELAW